MMDLSRAQDERALEGLREWARLLRFPEPLRDAAFMHDADGAALPDHAASALYMLERARAGR